MPCREPIYVATAGGIVPCGRCFHCKRKRRSDKTTRAILEGRMHEHALFVCLTYSNEFLPLEYTNPWTGQYFSHPDGVLDKRAVQLFKKRLARRFPPRTLRSLAVGEYGEKNLRPHYHLVIWGIPYSEREAIYESWVDPVSGRLMCHRDRLDIQVPRSIQDVGQYCAGYTMKKMTHPDDSRLEGRSPEFWLTSKGFGLSSVPGFVDAMRGESSQVYIEANGDIPRYFMLDGKEYYFDRYMRGKILDGLQIKDKISKIGQERFSDEMSALLDRARANPQIPKYLSYSEEPKLLGQALSKQYVAENAQAMDTAEHRAQLFDKGKKS